jgi:hypothetical protein
MIESVRKHQKMIILGVALSVVVLYVLPLDQIYGAVSPVQHIQDIFAKIRARIQGNDHLDAVKQSFLVGKINQIEQHVLNVLTYH